MSRLHDPGPGEVLDRLSILALKIVYAKQAGRAVDQWESELRALISALGGTLHDGSDHARAALVRQLELAAVNAALWQAEDEMRTLRDTPETARADWTGFHGKPWLHAAGLCGMRIQSLNDRRAELVTLINVNAGVDRPSDKL